ncbi:shikimate kinase [Metallosphaera tengchongensis]|uniref:Shikimate kinase n=1 Tax=Metallosphaera tengchongensis TaxID=1532350 RepID=A0A6N0NRT3_9CREN|nr:shikimate kinase [Metallosphaera tengchongensis]QKQ99465.1 shikimate kinase [Metallosphaera tengchongensis]
MQAYGGISVVNALPSWYGSSMAVNLKVVVEVSEGKNEENDVLVREILDYFRGLGIDNLRVEIKSEIPRSSGLKSSSAVSCALIGEIAKKFDLELDVPKLSAILSLKAGVSYTGALDDSVASFYGGISFTYNKEFRVIRKDRAPEDFIILVLAREGKGTIDLNKLRKFRVLFKEIFEMALSGRVVEAMKMNGIAVAEILGFPSEPIEESLRRGALASGISGNGPSYFAVVKEGEEGPVQETLERYGRVMKVRPINLDSRN